MVTTNNTTKQADNPFPFSGGVMVGGVAAFSWAPAALSS